MAIVSLILGCSFFGALVATHCDKVLNYHDNYGYGTDITCEDLQDEDVEMIQNISVSNEIALSIQQSNLTKVTPKIFENVSKVKFLSIINSTFRFNFGEEIFKNFGRLEHLRIENTKFNHISREIFKGLNELVDLSLINCSVGIIPNGTFEMMENLESLKLSKNRFSSLFDIPFCELSELKYVDLDHNEFRRIDDNFLVCFEKQEESNFKLNQRDFTISYQGTNMFQQTKSSFKVQELNLSHNQIDYIGFFDWALSTRSLDLSSNKLRNISANVFGVLVELEKLKLENNFIASIDEATLRHLQRLKLINLENNLLTSIHLKNLPNLEEATLSRNLLDSSSLIHLTDLPRLRKLLLNDNKIHDLPQNIFHNFTSLETLDLSNNQLIINHQPFINLTSLKHLYIRNNSLEEIPITLFRKLSSLETLDISSNKLGPVLDYRMFQDLKDLETLNMSRNYIEKLSYELFKPLRNLQVLDLSGNRLQDFRIDLVTLLPSLHVIDIKSNLLACNSLSTIITYLKSKDISYTINEAFEYDRKNVEGIYCDEISSRMLLKEGSGGRFTSAIGIMFLVIVSSAVFSFIFYKCLVYSRRRRYFMDEIELL